MMKKIEPEYYIRIGILKGDVVELDWIEKTIKGTDDTTVLQNLKSAIKFLNSQKQPAK